MAVQSFSLKKVTEQSVYIWNDRLCGLGMRWLVGLGLIAAGAMGVWYGKLPPEIPLWFSRPWGSSQLAAKEWIFVLPVSLAVMSLLALILAGMVYREEKLLARMVMGGISLIGFLLVYALLRIINLAI